MNGYRGLSRFRRSIDLIRVLGVREFRTRYRQSLLDLGWVFVVPAVTLLVYGYVLTRSFDVGATCGPYLSSAWLGLVIWTYWATVMAGAVSSLVSSANLITKVYFPREVMPLSIVVANAVDLGLGLVSVFVLMAIQGVGPSFATIGLIAPLAVLAVWTAALAVLVAVAAALARDVIQIVHLVVRVGIFATPVLFEGTVLPEGLRWTTRFNPVAVAIEQSRQVLLCRTWPDWSTSATHFGVGLIALWGAVKWARHKESRIADVI